MSSCECRAATPLTFDAGDRRQVGHADRALGVLGDDRHAAHAQLVVRVGLAQLGHELLVDPVDDLEVPRQQLAQELHRPDLEGLGQQGVARVREALLRDGPGLVPLPAALVDEDPHELGDRDDGVGVVELEDDALGQVAQVEVARQHLVEEVAQRARDEEVLLLEAQLLALRRRVLRVEDLGDVLRERLRPDGLRVVAGVEDLQVERPRRAGAPQPQGVHAAVLEARDHVVVGDAEDAPARHPAGARDAVVVVAARCARRSRR